MKYLCIENKGECEPEAFLLMGASTKRDDGHSIGLYGTGFKFAAAVLLREGVQPVVVSGAVRYKFGTENVVMRGQSFNRVTVQEGRHKPEPTQFTTEMGPNWTIDQAAKEIVSNAYDEPNAEVFVSGELLDRPGYTRVYIPYTGPIQQFYREFDRHFTFRRTPIAEGDGWRVFAGTGPVTRVYRRGVLVYENTELSACFDYQNDHLRVREDRTTDRYDAEQGVAWIMKTMGVEHLDRLIAFLSESEGDTWEGKNNYIDWYADEMAALLKDTIDGRVMVTRAQLEMFAAELSSYSIIILPDQWVKTLGKKDGFKTIKGIVSAPRLKGYREVDHKSLSESERCQLERAVLFTYTAGIDIDAFNLSVFEAMEGQSAPLGQALVESGTILINRTVLSHRLRDLVEVLLEEYVHCWSKNSDYTRGFQNALIANWVTSLEKFIPISQSEELAVA